jgi:hypothetical protein
MRAYGTDPVNPRTERARPGSRLERMMECNKGVVGCRADNIGRVICIPNERLASLQEDAMRAVLCPRPLLTAEGLLRLYGRIGTGVC